MFEKSVTFSEAKFYNEASFQEAFFKGSAHFSNVVFNDKVTFLGAVFENDADFHASFFGKDVHFENTAFDGYVDFGAREFIQIITVDPSWWTKTRTIFGKGSVFKGNAYFLNANFNSYVGFQWVVFEGYADFGNAIFRGNVDKPTLMPPWVAGPKGDVDFARVTCNKIIKFHNLKFKEKLPSFDFMKAHIAFGGGIIFDTGLLPEVYLSEVRQALGWAGIGFLGVEPEEIEKKVIFGDVLSSGLVDRERRISALELVADKETLEGYGRLLHAYRSLRIALEKKGMFPEAGGLYVREMEIKRIVEWMRLLGRRCWIFDLSKYEIFGRRAMRWVRNPFIRFVALLIKNIIGALAFLWNLFLSVVKFRIFHREFWLIVLNILYDKLSKYGEDWLRPIFWLVGSALGFGWVYYHFAGVKPGEALKLSLASIWPGLIKDLPDVAPWVHVIRAVQFAFSVVVVTLLALAIRRKFRRETGG